MSLKIFLFLALVAILSNSGRGHYEEHFCKIIRIRDISSVDSGDNLLLKAF